jgi:hypothetical protein
MDFVIDFRLNSTICFKCKSLELVLFESGSKLQRIEECAFQESNLTAITLPASVEVLCKLCFYLCKSLRSVLFESDSKLHQIEELVFERTGLGAIIIPASVEVFCIFSGIWYLT